MADDTTVLRVDEWAINQVDLDRDFAVPFELVIKWMQTGRMRMPWVGTGYAQLSEQAPKLNRRLVVMKQWVRARPGALGGLGGKTVALETRLGPVGKSSLPFQYRLTCDGEEVAVGEALMIVVAGAPGAFKSSPVPDHTRALAAGAARSQAANMLSRVAKQAPPGAFEYAYTVQPSDEDVNKHANHAGAARWLYNARFALAQSAHPLAPMAKKPLRSAEVEYSKESRVGDALSIRLSRCDAGGLAAHIYRGGDLLNRGWVDEGAEYEAGRAQPAGEPSTPKL